MNTDKPQETKHPDPLHSSNAKDVEELTASEYSYVVSMLQLNSLYGYGFITESEWNRGIKRVHAYGNRAGLSIVPTYYEIRLDNSIYRKQQSDEHISTNLQEQCQGTTVI